MGDPQDLLSLRAVQGRSDLADGTTGRATLLPMAAETSQTLDRGLRVLAVLADHPSGLTVTELATEIGVNRTVVYRLITTLEQHGLARRDGTGRLHVGLGVLALARGLQPVLREVAGPVLRSLAEDLGATAHLTLADGGEALAIAVVEPSWTDYHVAYRVGARHPLDQGAAGRAILLGRDLPGPRPTGERFVHTSGELQPGAQGLASPVLGVEGFEASVGVITLGEIELEVAGARVVAAADDIAKRLG